MRPILLHGQNFFEWTGLDVYTLIIALIVFVYVMTRYSKVKSFIEAERKISEVPTFHDWKSKRKYKKEERLSKKKIKDRYNRADELLIVIGLMSVVLVIMGLKEFAFPALVIVANASGTRIPPRTPILGRFSHDLDVLWNAMCNSSLHQITDELGRLNRILIFKSYFTFLPFIGTKIKEDPQMLLLLKVKKAEHRYLWVLLINYLKVVIAAYLIAVVLSMAIPGYDMLSFARTFMILPFAIPIGYISSIMSLNLLKMIVRENPVEREVTGKKESFLLKRFMGGMKEREEWIVSSDFVKRTGSRYASMESEQTSQGKYQ